MPTLSVLMPVRNAGRYLAASLASLARQSYTDFEVIAVDDGSNDGSGERLERAALAEPRLRVLRQSASGIPAALNAGLALARGEWIARQDADDVSRPERFALQMAWLHSHPEDTVVGCRIALAPRRYPGIGMRRWATWHNRLSTHEDMVNELLVDSPLAHGTAMTSRRALIGIGGWRDRGWPEDVDLWLRLRDAGARFAKVPRILYDWRQHGASATRHDPRYHQTSFDALRMDALERGLLQGRPTVNLIGVGSSLGRWRAHLARSGRRVHAFATGRPGTLRVDPRQAPVVLVFGAAIARERWRSHLRASGGREREDFIFVA